MFCIGFSHTSCKEIHNFDSLSHFHKGMYWTGRTIRFPLEILGSALDIALQIAGVATFALYLIASLVENLISQKPQLTYSNVFLYVSIFVHEIGEITVNSELSYLLQDLNLRDSKERTFNILKLFFDKKLPTSQDFIKTK